MRLLQNFRDRSVPGGRRKVPVYLDRSDEIERKYVESQKNGDYKIHLELVENGLRVYVRASTGFGTIFEQVVENSEESIGKAVDAAVETAYKKYTDSVAKAELKNATYKQAYAVYPNKFYTTSASTIEWTNAVNKFKWK